ncbi:MAG: MBL fold metallo-hydrolase, partial [Bowdeniella nasicola]|nr:MBL fold metallo-hydrolase [Bowdeniella nasicola]
MIIHRLISPTLACNCYILSPANANGAVVVDPGDDTAGRIAARLKKTGHEVAAVLATHGHPDHIWDADRVAGLRTVTLASADHYRMDDPSGTLPPGFDFELIATHPYRRAERIADIPQHLHQGDGGQYVTGVPIRALAAPGHTEGSTVYLTVGELDGELAREAGVAPDSSHPVLLSGDVLFAGSIGRTDLPGGDHEEMIASLRTLAAVIDP